jgi:hypothetical protein
MHAGIEQSCQTCTGLDISKACEVVLMNTFLCVSHPYEDLVGSPGYSKYATKNEQTRREQGTRLRLGARLARVILEIQ